MFGERGGISAAGVGVLLAVWQAVVILAEIPTGIIADKFSKKWVLVAAKLLRVLAFGAWLVAPNFVGYLTGFIFWGIAEALNSGAFQAYLYESLSEQNKGVFGRLYSRVSALTMVAYTIAYVVSFVIGTDYNLLLMLSVLACVIAVGIALSLPAGTVIRSVEKPQLLRSAVIHIAGSAALKELLVGAIIIGAMANVLIEYMALYNTQAGLPVRYVSLVLAASNLVGALLYWSMSLYDRFLAKHRVVLVVLCVGAFAATFGGDTAAQILGMIILVRGMRLLQIHYEAAMQHLSNDAARATIGSLYSFTAKTVAVAMFLLIGFLAVGDRITDSLRSVILPAALLYILVEAFLGRRRRRVDKLPL